MVNKINSKRIVFALLKVTIYIMAFVILALAVYIGINKLVLPGSVVQKENSSVTVDEQNYPQEEEGNKIAIVVGTASVLMAILTMLQQHISRYQDRALAFPRMILRKCHLYIGENAVEEQSSFYNDRGGKLLIKIDYEEAFSSCYVPCIYRVKVIKKPYGDTDDRGCFKCIRKRHKENKNSLKIINSFSYLGEKGLSIEVVCVDSDTVKDYCEKMQGTKDYKLNLVLDVCWRNELLMYGLRTMSNMYVFAI